MLSIIAHTHSQLSVTNGFYWEYYLLSHTHMPFIYDNDDDDSSNNNNNNYVALNSSINTLYSFTHSCVADNALGRAKKYIEVSGRPGPAQFHSPLYSRARDLYNLTWSIESIPKLEEIRILYRKLMVSMLKLLMLSRFTWELLSSLNIHLNLYTRMHWEVV